jgi:DNA repair protein RadA/Sms
MVEETYNVDKKKSVSVQTDKNNLSKLNNIELGNEFRIKSNIEEFDRVLGGGIVSGSVVLLGGDPGIGKSTLMLQVCSMMKDKTILYVSGEESQSQIKMRADRIKFSNDNFYILSETEFNIIHSVIEQISPELVIVDSIQTIYRSEIDSSPGSLAQLRESAAALIKLAKTRSIPVILIGHITKEGVIAGPKVLEHMVDTVLQFEGEQSNIYRILRAVKNRFGSSNEIGIFEMTGEGLSQVLNPSEIFLSHRNMVNSGSTITASIEGSRSLLIEVQALVTLSPYSVPQRTETGYGYKKLALLIAVIEKKFGLNLNRHDVFLNIAGGLKIDEPAIDLAAAASIISSFRDLPVDNKTIILGAVGLGGEIRAINFADRRIQEAVKLGFKKIIVPSGNMKTLKNVTGIDVIPVETIQEAANHLFNNNK